MPLLAEIGQEPGLRERASLRVQLGNVNGDKQDEQLLTCAYEIKSISGAALGLGFRLRGYGVGYIGSNV